MMTITHKKYFIIGFLILFLIGVPNHNNAFAAQISVVPNSSTISQNQVLDVSVILDTQGEDANAVQGTVTYPTNEFKLGVINDGGSAISFWLTPPASSSSTSGEINFAGIIPGGFTGSAGNIFSFTLEPLATGTADITISSSSILANDGNGSPLHVTVVNALVNIYASNNSSTPMPPSNDYTPPNVFTPQIVSDPNIFGGNYFLVFNTTDNKSGIDHYEVLEVPNGSSQKPFSSWQIATSPYILTDQNLSSDIYVRAVDHNGNFLVVKIPARYPRSAAKNILFLLGILLAMVMVLLLLWTWHRQRRA